MDLSVLPPPRTAWERLTQFISLVHQTPHPNQHFLFHYEAEVHNSSLRINGQTYRYGPAAPDVGQEGVAREALSRQILHTILASTPVFPNIRKNMLARTASAWSDLSELPPIESVFPHAASLSQLGMKHILPTASSSSLAVKPNIPALFQEAPDSATERLQYFIADLYGDDTDLFERVAFTQPEEPHDLRWMVQLMGRDYRGKHSYRIPTDASDDERSELTSLGHESAVREAISQGALHRILQDNPLPEHYKEASLELVAKFSNLTGLSQLPKSTTHNSADDISAEYSGHRRSRSHSRHRSSSRHRSRSRRRSKLSHRSSSRRRRSRDSEAERPGSETEGGEDSDYFRERHRKSSHIHERRSSQEIRGRRERSMSRDRRNHRAKDRETVVDSSQLARTTQAHVPPGQVSAPAAKGSYERPGRMKLTGFEPLTTVPIIDTIQGGSNVRDEAFSLAEPVIPALQATSNRTTPTTLPKNLMVGSRIDVQQRELAVEVERNGLRQMDRENERARRKEARERDKDRDREKDQERDPDPNHERDRDRDRKRELDRARDRSRRYESGSESDRFRLEDDRHRRRLRSPSRNGIGRVRDDNRHNRHGIVEQSVPPRHSVEYCAVKNASSSATPIAPAALRNTSDPLSAALSANRHPIGLTVQPILKVLSSAMEATVTDLDKASNDNDSAVLDAILAGLSVVEKQQFLSILEACRSSAKMQNVRSAFNLDKEVGAADDLILLPRKWVMEMLDLLQTVVGDSKGVDTDLAMTE